MRTLVEAEGPVETSVVRPSTRGVAVDRKVSFLVRELKKYDVHVTGISETKWFGQAVYEVEGYTILHSGRPVPTDAPMARNEGVAIVLDPALTAAWKEAGGVWEAVSSRIVSARLKVTVKKSVRSPKSHDQCPSFLTLVNVYAPTFKSAVEVKEQFYADLQAVIDAVDEHDALMVVGDFNARVGSSDVGRRGRLWDGVRGVHGTGKMNEAGRELLIFCALNELTITNTFFEKKSIHKNTWQHPGSKKWHCIDFVIMRQSQRRLCADVSVLRCADCWTDHKLLVAKVQLHIQPKSPSNKIRGHFAVAGLRNSAVRMKFSKSVMDEVNGKWHAEAGGEEKWKVLEESMKKAAEEVLGRERRRQPDWFLESIGELEELIVKRNALFATWLRTRCQRDRQRYVNQRREVAREVKRAKNNWFKQKASEVERGMHRGKGAWKGLREIQKGRAGLRSIKRSSVKHLDGTKCVGQEDTLQRWHEHFELVLNVNSSFDENVFQSVEQHPLRSEMAEPPSEEEVIEALGKVKINKAPGKNGILPEMVRGCGGEMLTHIMDLFCTVWREGRVPAEWRDAILVPIPKKGDLSQCDSWRGISLLDTMGKLFTKVIQVRLQKVAEEVLPDSQCGFRRDRGCVDMIYSARQLMEKTKEHRSKLFMLFVDLRKAYDSVPRQALWLVLQKYGIPPVLVNLIKSLHEGMTAEVRVGGATSPGIQVTNGLRQGCTIAPTLFNLYFNLVVEEWRRRCQPLGVEVLYKFGGKLVGERTRRPSKVAVTELQFADDVAVLGSTREEIERTANVLEEVASQWGLTVSLSKTKLLVVNGSADCDDLQPLNIGGAAIEVVPDFRYLGAIMESKGEIMKDVEERIARASKAFGALCRPVFRDSSLSLVTKRMVYRAVVLGVLLYGAETWTNKRAATQKLESFNNKCLRRIMGITRAQQRIRRITSAQVRKKFGVEETLEDVVTAKRLRWLGHVARMKDDRLPKQILFGWLPQKRPAHGVRMRWRDRVRKDLKNFYIKEKNWFEIAQDRGEWKAMCKKGLHQSMKKGFEKGRNRGCGSVAAVQPFICEVCHRTFRRRQDIARHKCQRSRDMRRQGTNVC